MNDELAKFIVNDKDSFITFVGLLRDDLLSNKESWENKKLKDFLEAIAVYAEDIQGHYDNKRIKLNSEEANWQTFADIFKGATVYK